MAARDTTKPKPRAANKKADSSAPQEPDEAALETSPFRERLRLLYLGRSLAAHRFRYALVAFDIVTILFIIGTSFAPAPKG